MWSPLLAAIDATGIAVIIGAIFLGVTQVVTMVLAYFREKDKIARDKIVAQKVEQVAVKQEEDGKATAEKLDGIADIGHKAHDLANSETLARKKKYAEKCAAMAKVTGKPEDIREAELSSEEYLEHQRTHDAMIVRQKTAARVKKDQHDEIVEKIEEVPDKTVEKLNEQK